MALNVLTSGSQRLYSWWTAKSTRDQLLENLDEARLFEEWEASAYQLDEVSGLDLWYTVFSPSIPYSSTNNSIIIGARIPPRNTTTTVSSTNAFKPSSTPAKMMMSSVSFPSFAPVLLGI